MDKPDPKDPKYRDSVNAYCKDMRLWESTQYRPLEPPPFADIPTVVEVGRADLKIGDVLVSKQDQRRTFRIEELVSGMNGHGWPYLTLRDPDGKKLEHDTSLDAPSATYTVRR